MAGKVLANAALRENGSFYKALEALLEVIAQEDCLGAGIPVLDSWDPGLSGILLTPLRGAWGVREEDPKLTLS